MFLGIHKSLMKRARLFTPVRSRKQVATKGGGMVVACPGVVPPKPRAGYRAVLDIKTCTYSVRKKTFYEIRRRKLEDERDAVFSGLRKANASGNAVDIARAKNKVAINLQALADLDASMRRAPAPRSPVVEKRTTAFLKNRNIQSVFIPAPARSVFIPTVTQRAPAVSVKPGAFTTTPTKVVRTPITPAPVVPLTPASGFDAAKILPLAIGAGAALLMMRG